MSRRKPGHAEVDASSPPRREPLLSRRPILKRRDDGSYQPEPKPKPSEPKRRQPNPNLLTGPRAGGDCAIQMRFKRGNPGRSKGTPNHITAVSTCAAGTRAGRRDWLLATTMRIKQMDDPTTRRRRRRQHDGYYDDTLQDGESLRVPMTLADAAMVDTVRRLHPPRYHYGTRFLHDARAPATSPTVRGAGSIAPDTPSDPVQQPWPTSNSGNYPIWGYSPGQSCKTVEGKPGKLCPHPSNSSILICMPDSSDSSMDATSVYYKLRDEKPHRRP
jgi:hypothetical protein